ncbi:unnamed protein product [Adineta steineri]|uniref:FLYWCH-type domain-containing protein n=1 Tax=Adineta steineri TaxID=433720 RepID=A0A819P6V0_9BILA|nr:unnamed protein product [Adineta steineri]CAF4008213.1 unnamed protein product [Adineta steineri]
MSNPVNTSTNKNINLSFLTSNKAQRLLVLNDNLFRCNKKNAKKRYWKCIVHGCTLTVHTDNNDVYKSGGTVNHDHPPHTDMIQTLKLRQQMKQRVIKELTPISVIYEEETAKASVDRAVLASFPTNQEIYQTFASIRRKLVPPLPVSCMFEIPDQYKLTANGERFLLFDESVVRRERLLLYGSDLQLDLLFDSQIIYMDATFSKAPPHFSQIFIIHAVNFDICLPCVFALMVNKKSVSYRQIFFELKQKAAERNKSFSPRLILTDFESGMLPVVKAEQLGLQKDYMENEILRGLCRKLMCLAMMPEDTILDSYDEIRYHSRKLSGLPMEPLLNYFEKQWLSDIGIWNVSTINSRTNNCCEGE